MTDPTEKIIKLMQTDKSEDAPEDAITWSKNIFKTRAVEQSGIVSSVARLVKEISGAQLATGERSSAAGQEMQMLFETDELSIDLRVKESEGTFTVSGQVLGVDDDSGSVRIGEHETAFDEFGGFEISGLPAGEYSVEIRNGNNETKIEQISLK